MKNVAFLYSDITTTGGIEKSISNISNELCKDSNYNINIISIKQKNIKPFFYFNSKIKIEYLYKKDDEKENSVLDNILRLRKYLKKNSIEILIVANIALNIVAVPAIIGKNIKLVSWEHFGINNNLSNKYIDLARKITVKFSDYLIVLTQYDKEEYIKRFKFGKKVRIEQIYNPIPPIFQKDNNYDNKTILTIGHFLPVKGYDLLLQVVKFVLTERKEWKWIIIGDGKYEDEFINEVDRSEVKNRVIIKRRVKNVDDFYQGASIYVNTSRSEGFALTILEAKAHHIPIIAFDIPAMDELVIDKKNGRLIEKYNIQKMGQVIIDLIDDKERREEYSRNSLIDTEKLKLANIIEKWKEILK